MDDARLLRGAEIVRQGGVLKLRRGIWQVRSQSHGGTYVVGVAPAITTCTCLDYQTRGSIPGFACKHVLAAAIRRRVIPFPAHLMPSRKPTYSQDWSAYNRGQENEIERAMQLLTELCSGIVDPPQTIGRPRMPLATTIYAMVGKIYEGKSQRRSASSYRAAQALGLIEETPSSSKVWKSFPDPQLTPLLRELLHQTARPLAAIEEIAAVDSTGMSTCEYERYFDVKHGGKKSEKVYIKLHAAVGTLTHVIMDAVVTEEFGGGDAPRLPELIQAASQDFPGLTGICADKAYLSRRNVDAIAAIGATPYIPMKTGTSGAKGSDAWRKMAAMFLYKAEDFMANYHARSNVEAVFSALKRKFDGSLRNKLFVAQQNEVLCKCIAYNLSVLVAAIYEIGLEPTFWNSGSSEPTPPPLLS